MYTDEYRIELRDLPHRVRGMVSLDDDGYATIIINARLSNEAQHRAVDHELDHLEHGDHDSGVPLNIIESRASVAG